MTLLRCLAVRVFIVLSLLVLPSAILRAQSNDAQITGIVTDPQKAIIRGAKIVLVNVDTGVRYPGVTNGSGIYRVSGQVGNYRLEVEHVGFRTVIAPNIVLHTQDALEINFEMAVGSASESVTVNSEATNVSPAVSMTVSREFVEKMPLNGRSFQDLIQLAPGTVSSSGYYSINGQRTDGNNYTVDGVSANLGGYINNTGTYSMAGSTPSQTALGTTQSLASIDSLQEFKIQTSGYTAEYGRNPGGQAGFTTRSGTNDIHGSLFEYFRNTVLDANSWSNNYYHNPKPAERQNDFGGTVGGPLVVPKIYNGKEKTFYFFSYEGLRLLLPQGSASLYVPTKAFRNWASPYVQPFANALPLPNASSSGNQDGCTIPDPTTGQPTACDALFTQSYSNPNNLDNISVRLDHNLSKRLRAFVRYADTPSSSAYGVPWNPSGNIINAHIWTAGLTANLTSNLLDDFRFNYSYDGEESVKNIKPVNGSVPWARNLLIPAAYENSFDGSETLIYVPGSSLSVNTLYQGAGTAQHQYQLVDSLAWTRGKHSPKFGIDWRRLTPTYSQTPYQSIAAFESLPDIQRGYATILLISASAPGQPVFDNLSVYAEDHWKVSPGLSLDYGLRWEFNPPPGPSNGHYPITLTSSNLATAQIAPIGTVPYKTYYNHFAPRFGFAWNAIQSRAHALTVRGGFGIFYDTGQQIVGNSYTGVYPFNATRPNQASVAFPLTDADLAPPSLNFPLVAPYPYLNDLSSPDLTSPYTEQWNLSLDEALNAKNTLTVSYVGNNGRKLLFVQDYTSAPLGNPMFPAGLLLTGNAAQSSYNALQVQDTGRLVDGLDIVASFTYGHALDNASQDGGYVPVWGNSQFDRRRVLNLALNYETPAAGTNRWLQGLTHGWLLANRFSTQSGTPVDIIQSYVTEPDGSEVPYRPDLVPHVPIYLHGNAADINGQPAPANWRLNRAAFACTTNKATSGACTGTPTRQGTLGRNYLRTPSFWSFNMALQRSFAIYEQLHLDFRVDAFNIFNHPNLSNSGTTSLSASNFGQALTSATIGSSNALYAMGAARSLQLSLKLKF